MMMQKTQFLLWFSAWWCKKHHFYYGFLPASSPAQLQGSSRLSAAAARVSAGGRWKEHDRQAEDEVRGAVHVEARR